MMYLLTDEEYNAMVSKPALQEALDLVDRKTKALDELWNNIQQLRDVGAIDNMLYQRIITGKSQREIFGYAAKEEI